MSTPLNHPAQPRTERMARLLTSNDPPLDIEEQTYRVVITQGQTRLIEIDEQIADMRAALGSLLLQRKQLQMHMDDHKAVMNPIRRMPADILSVIFALYAPPVTVNYTEFMDVFRDSLDVAKGPWILGRVCRRWRSLVELDFPVLWSSLNVLLEGLSERSMLRRGHTGERPAGDRPLGHSLYLLGRHLRSARSVPLSIGLFSRHDLDNSENPLLYSLTPYSDQWKNLRLFFVIPSSYRCMSHIKGRLNSLESLHLVGVSNARAPILPTEPFDAFSLAPQLRKLTVWGIPSVWLSHSLPWSQITAYKWSRCPPHAESDSSQHIAILQLMSNLEECNLECQWSSEGAASRNQSIQLPRLRTLHLNGFGQFGGTALLDLLGSICAPALHDLSITQDSDKDFAGIGVVKDFIIRSACPLAYLALPPAKSLTDHDLIQLFHHAPSLSKITLASDVLTDHLLGQLTYRDGAEGSLPPVAPNLHSITMKNLAAASRFSPELFFDMIASRWSTVSGSDGHNMGQVARFRSVELIWKIWEDELPPSLLENPRLDQFRSEGLHIVCTSKQRPQGLSGMTFESTPTRQQLAKLL